MIVVGFMMVAHLRDIDFTDLLDGFPALMAIIVMPLTYSITNGIGAAFVTYVLRIVSGRARDIHPLLWVVTGAFVVYFAMPLVETLV